MSDIEIGNVWFNRCDGVEAIVKSVGNDCVGFTQIINGKKYFYSHTMEEFKEYYEPKVKAEMINQPKHYNDESSVPCCDVTDFMMFNGGNCFKYLYRCGNKWDDIEDLKKAVWYAKRSYLTGDNEQPNSLEWDNNVKAIAGYREGGIYKAMTAIRSYSWVAVAAFIEAEIARLESE